MANSVFTEKRNYIIAAGFVFLTMVAFFCGPVRAEDWPTYMHDNHRSGLTGEQLKLPLSQFWVFKAGQPPQPAWPKPARQDYFHNISKMNPAVTYDRAFHLAIVDGDVYFGSSADDKVYCLDGQTGQVRWSFFTEGPVRLAPTVSDGKLYVGSDDGWMYCLKADDGKLLWKQKPSEEDYQLPGNGRMISMWPIRSSVLVDGRTAYCSAGLFPEQNVYLCELNSEDGAVQWKEKINVSSQGYMLASDTQLFTPVGRINPAMFDRKNGDYRGSIESVGGTFAMISDDVLISGPGRTDGAVQISDIDNRRESIATFGGLCMIVKGQMAYLLSHHKISALNRVRYVDLARQVRDLRGQQSDVEKRLRPLRDKRDEQSEQQRNRLSQELEQIKISQKNLGQEMQQCYVWEQPGEYPYSLIMVGDVLFAGGQDKVAAISAADGKELWQGSVNGRAYGLAAADGKLFVSTDKGIIHCFSSQPVAEERVVTSSYVRNPFGKDSFSALYARAADHIVEQTGIKQGYCLVLGCGEGRLAYELAQRTDLKIIGVEEDAQKVAAARKALDKAGLYGRRVVVHQGFGDKLPYAKYFANLIVADQTLVTGEVGYSPTEIFRVLRPCGGVAYIGQLQKQTEDKAGPAWSNIERWVDKAARSGWQVSGDGGLWAGLRRGELIGSGEWTHQYAEPGNSACSMDSLVRSPMRLQWFGRPGPYDMIDRHHRNVAPLYKNGRLFVPGDDIVYGMDAYNGTVQWEVGIPKARRLGVFLDNSNMIVDDNFLYVAAEDKCYGFDVGTGNRQITYMMPQLLSNQLCQWGYIAYKDDLLFGSGCLENASYIETSREADKALWYHDMKLVVSEYLFGMKKQDGKLLWEYRDGLIINPTISVGGEQIYFVEVHNPKARAEKLGRMSVRFMFDGAEVYLVALNTSSGNVTYKKKIDVSAFQEPIFLNYAKNVLLLSGSKLIGDDVHYSFYAFDADSGEIRWQRDHSSGLAQDGGHGEYNRHPTIIDNTVYAWPYAYNLQSGQQIEGWYFERRGHGCGGVSASAYGMFWRGGNPWMYDLTEQGGPVCLNRVSRPGCWINMIPAGGLVMIPEASSGCSCGFPLQISMAFVPK